MKENNFIICPKTKKIFLTAVICLLIVFGAVVAVKFSKADEADVLDMAELPAEEARDDDPATVVVSENEEVPDEDDLPGYLVARRETDDSGQQGASDHVTTFDPDAGFTEKDISDIVTALQMVRHYSDYVTGLEKGYRTESSELEVAGPFPWYYLKADGTLDESVSEFCIIFDDGEPVLFIVKSRVVGAYYWDFDNVGENVYQFEPEGWSYNFHVTTTFLERIEAGGTEFAFISGNDETVLVDGDELYEADCVAQCDGEHPIYYTEYDGWESIGDHSALVYNTNGKPVDLTGLVLGSTNNRQTFEYRSPE